MIQGYHEASADDDLGMALMMPMLVANMAGQLMVHEHEAKRDVVELSRHHLSTTPEPAFLRLPWTEAIEAFRERGVITDQDLSRLIRDYAAKSEQDRSRMLEVLQNRTHEALAKAMEQGEAMDSFAQRMRDIGDDLGIGIEHDHYLETVYRTNTHQAYVEGRERAATDPDIIEVLPYAQFRSVDDFAVRHTHRALHGIVVRKDSDAFQQAMEIIREFNCRCSFVSLDDDDLADEGLTLSDALPPEAFAA